MAVTSPDERTFATRTAGTTFSPNARGVLDGSGVSLVPDGEPDSAALRVWP